MFWLVEGLVGLLAMVMVILAVLAELEGKSVTPCGEILRLPSCANAGKGKAVLGRQDNSLGQNSDLFHLYMRAIICSSSGDIKGNTNDSRSQNIQIQFNPDSFHFTYQIIASDFQSSSVKEKNKKLLFSALLPRTSTRAGGI